MAHKSTLKRAQQIAQIVQEYYEPGRQDRSKTWVYRTKIRPLFGICQRTFFYYLHLLEQSNTQSLQLSLW